MELTYLLFLSSSVAACSNDEWSRPARVQVNFYLLFIFSSFWAAFIFYYSSNIHGGYIMRQVDLARVKMPLKNLKFQSIIFADWFQWFFFSSHARLRWMENKSRNRVKLSLFLFLLDRTFFHQFFTRLQVTLADFLQHSSRSFCVAVFGSRWNIFFTDSTSENNKSSIN